MWSYYGPINQFNEKGLTPYKVSKSNGNMTAFSSLNQLIAQIQPDEIFNTLLETQVLIERWGKKYNEFRPHSALGYRHPAREAVKPKEETLT